ncbi:MAG: hypothetical protein ACQEP1_02110 [Nanobdellota archaeon]
MRPHVLFIIVLMIVLISGCSTEKSEEGDVNFRRGTQGLEMKLLKNNPPRVVYEGDVLPVGLELYNKGAHTINEGWLYITGYDTGIIGTTGSSTTGQDLDAYSYLPNPSQGLSFGELPGRSQFNREGGYKLIQRQSGEINLPSGTEKYQIPIMIYALYEYETLASDTVCIDPNPHRSYGDKACVSQDVSMGSGQGAPVTVSHVKVDNMRNKMRFTFNIRNAGNGDVIDLQDIWEPRKRPTGFSPADMNTVDLIEVQVGEESITKNCEPSNNIKISEGGGRVSCTYPDIGGGSAYKTSLSIELEYGYRTHIKRNIEIRGYEE